MDRYIKDISIVSTFSDLKRKQQQTTFIKAMYSNEKESLLKNDNSQSYSSSDETPGTVNQRTPSLNGDGGKEHFVGVVDDIGDYEDDEDQEEGE